MTQMPDAAALLEAVRELLTNEIQPTIEDRGLRFKLLIAANVLGIVERELRAGEPPLDAAIERLQTLMDLQPDHARTLAEKHVLMRQLEKELCVRIRAGDADEGGWAAQVQAHITRTLIDELRYTNPRFLKRIGLTQAVD